MSLIDFILNVAGVLLWLNWRSIRLDPLTGATPATLAGTLRRIEPSRLQRWHYLAFLVGLIFVRAVFYRQIGPAVNWTPRLDLGVVSLAFRANSLGQELLFSTLSFLHVLAVLYFWLLALALINGRGIAPDPFQKMLSLQLGRGARWPRPTQAIAPLLIVGLLWVVIHPLLAYVGVINWAQTKLHLAEQSLLVGAGIYLSLKYLLPAFLLLHLIASYVYLGKGPFWDFIGITARNILAPLNRVPLRFGKVDFAPLVGVILLLLLLQTLPEVLRNKLIERKLPVWPL